VSLTLRHSHVPGGHPPWPARAPVNDPRDHHRPHPHHTAPLLVLTTLRPGTADHLHKVARLAQTLGTGLRLAWWADEPATGLSHPIARLQQRARALRRHHALAVDVVITPVCARTDALLLAREARLTCLADAPLAGHLLAPLLRAGHGPVWVIHRDTTRSAGGVHCLLRADPLDAPLLAWAGQLARQRPLHLVHVLPTALPADDPRDVVALTVFDHMQRQRRLQAHQTLDTLAAPLRAAPGQPHGEPPHGLHTTVLHGDVTAELQAHVARSAVGTLVVGHTRRRWWPWAGMRARPLLPHADDTLVVPLPARPLRATLRRAWAGLLAAVA
jgi:hypothetical protein